MRRSGSAVSAPAWADPAEFSGADVLCLPSGRLGVEERVRLSELTERIQVAHDLLLAFSDRYEELPVRFAGSQAREIALLQALRRRYESPESREVSPPGRYVDLTTRSAIDRLVIRGRSGRAEAVAAVADGLRRILALLDSELVKVSAPDVHDAYCRLHAATIRQLRGVQVWTAR